MNSLEIRAQHVASVADHCELLRVRARVECFAEPGCPSAFRFASQSSSAPCRKPSRSLLVPSASAMPGGRFRKSIADRFPSEGTHLMRYASRFPAVEINSCFYRSHKPDTYLKVGTVGAGGFPVCSEVAQRGDAHPSPRGRGRYPRPLSLRSDFRSGRSSAPYSSSFHPA